MQPKFNSGTKSSSASYKEKSETVLKDGVTEVPRPLSSLQPERPAQPQTETVFFLGNHVLLFPMLGFGLAASLVAIMTMNHLPFGQMAANSRTQVPYMSASADFQEVVKDCKELAIELQQLALQGNSIAYKAADHVMSPSICKGYINPKDFGF